jgi:CRISPR system Cascade subunit CasC
MKLELHVLQNFAPSNLNRDDTGAPKDCELGGYRRARISSQSLKRAMRDVFVSGGDVQKSDLGLRTKRLVHKLVEELTTKHKLNEKDAEKLAIAGVEGVGLGRSKKGEGQELWKTEYLIFVPSRVVALIGEVLFKHKDDLLLEEPAPEAAGAVVDPDGAAPKKKKSAKDAKKDAKSAFPSEAKKEIVTLLNGSGPRPFRPHDRGCSGVEC